MFINVQHFNQFVFLINSAYYDLKIPNEKLVYKVRNYLYLACVFLIHEEDGKQSCEFFYSVINPAITVAHYLFLECNPC